MVIVEGKIKGKDRPRFFKGHTYTPKASKDYEKIVKDNYISQGGKLLETPVKVNIIVWHKIPKATTKKELAEIRQGSKLPTKKPDIDNIAKIILDGLNGIAFKDDTQVVKLTIVKKFTESIECVEFEVNEYKA